MFLESHVSSGGSTRNLARKYFSELDIMTVRRLYEFYKVDFEMFGYSPDEYFEIAKTQTPSSPDPSSVLPSTITDSSETSQASTENHKSQN